LARLEWFKQADVGFGPSGMNGLEFQKSILALLEWLGIEEVGFGMTRTAWKERRRFGSFRSSLEWLNSVTDCL
jgi:hypothetical protein